MNQNWSLLLKQNKTKQKLNSEVYLEGSSPSFQITQKSHSLESTKGRRNSFTLSPPLIISLSLSLSLTQRKTKESQTKSLQLCDLFCSYFKLGQGEREREMFWHIQIFRYSVKTNHNANIRSYRTIVLTDFAFWN